MRVAFKPTSTIGVSSLSLSLSLSFIIPFMETSPLITAEEAEYGDQGWPRDKAHCSRPSRSLCCPSRSTFSLPVFFISSSSSWSFSSSYFSLSLELCDHCAAVPMVEAMVALVMVDQLMAHIAQCEMFPMNPSLQQPASPPAAADLAAAAH